MDWFRCQNLLFYPSNFDFKKMILSLLISYQDFQETASEDFTLGAKFYNLQYSSFKWAFNTQF